MLKRAVPVAIVFLILSPSVTACLWDRDTPRDEAMDMPEVVTALTGRFERNPPLYYELRLARILEHVQDHPQDLDAYDDAGVACDRLGRGDEAIKWMEAKLRKIESDEETDSEHRYRYHANLGTFLIHKWLRQGADRSQMDEVHAAREQIALAIEINPNAHYGREVYQLRAMDWIMSPPEKPAGFQEHLPNLLGWSFDDIYGTQTEPNEADEAVRALAGLVILGDAWESVDIFNALNVALQRNSVGYERSRDGGRNTLAYFAWLRCNELIDAGKHSLFPGSPTGRELQSMLRAPDFVRGDLLLEPVFNELREEAERWHAKRTEFMNQRLSAGRHPDTDSDFWNGYAEASAPQLPATSVPEAYHANQAWKMKMALVVVVGFFVAILSLIAIAVKSQILKSRSNRKSIEREIP